ncbi:MAG: 50S ribosomal protein L15 [Candidatus Nealsonbacteria bacterium RIFCSPLOWO2_01_FULL_43_32]|uniref:Large ribosomal subunit protein uL15 n=1 Tax=Candidatus Nealsonbacteria bacterium RIFCSPLOWO2_01_FULL_43_32 TaxID=1801672 RepID=A0A1G2EFR4_9BACT|nr:MAG: 50S ribosomal protein L15 [Candidatus Nealsonbacteria bacterium RIFCSPLOWO2_01_FULL_43_32]
MQLHQLKPRHKRQTQRRAGRGGKRGTYSGRGIKGQKARSGGRLQPSIREFIKRYPKLRGYRLRSQAIKPVVVNIEALEKKFKTGDQINPQVLLDQGLIRRIKGKTPVVKILGQGKLTKSLTVEGCLLSKTAREQIEKNHGVVK